MNSWTSISLVTDETRDLAFQLPEFGVRGDTESETFAGPLIARRLPMQAKWPPLVEKVTPSPAFARRCSMPE